MQSENDTAGFCPGTVYTRSFGSLVSQISLFLSQSLGFFFLFLYLFYDLVDDSQTFRFRHFCQGL